MGYKKGISALGSRGDLYVHCSEHSKARERQDGEDCLVLAGHMAVCTWETTGTGVGPGPKDTLTNH